MERNRNKSIIELLAEIVEQAKELERLSKTSPADLMGELLGKEEKPTIITPKHMWFENQGIVKVWNIKV